MKGKNKFLIFTFIFVLISTHLFAEKWVGQANTYQLKPDVLMTDGTPFDKNKITAACNCFRIGAKVKVTNTKTGRSAEVTVTDRINNESNYFILLSPKAAAAIGAEWENCIVIVQADFRDINSDDVLKVHGLIPENQLDPDALKEFPDINWPDDSEEETVSEEDNNDDDDDDIPDFVKELLDDEDEYFEDIPFDTEDDEDEEELSNTENIDDKLFSEADPKSPETEQPDNDTSENKPAAEPVKTSCYPAEDSTLSPALRNSVTIMEENRITPDRPAEDSPLMPYSVQKSTVSDEDYAGVSKVYPQEEYTRRPVWGKWKVNSDEIFGKNHTARPAENKTEELSDNIIFINEDDELVTAMTAEMSDDAMPDTASYMTSTDDDTVMIPYIEHSYTADESEEFEWVTSLEPDKIYVRFMTIYDKSEARRMARNFKSITGKITVYKTDDKFVLLCGPYDSDNDAFRALSDLKSMGFSDAYLLSE